MRTMYKSLKIKWNYLSKQKDFLMCAFFDTFVTLFLNIMRRKEFLINGIDKINLHKTIIV